MEIQERGSGKIYALASSSAVPEWLSERSRRNLSKRDSTFRHRITLLQDLEMPVASTKIRQSPDGKFLLVGGTYSPRIRCYELAEMSMKFERYLDSEVVDLCILSEDYGKLAILGSDRTIMFHAPYGNHDKIRLPTFGRAMAYEKTTCDLMVVSSGKRPSSSSSSSYSSSSESYMGGEVYRFNLDEGRFSQPYSFASALGSSSSGRYNDGTPQTVPIGGGCISVSPTHSLCAIGAEDGTVRFWDTRAPAMTTSSRPNDMHLTPFINLDVASAVSGRGFFDHENSTANCFPGEVTSLCFDDAGMRMCAGTKGGNVALYDMRSSKPLFVKEHRYGLPIHTVQFHSGSGTILSSDAKLVKIWNARGTGGSSSSSSAWNGDDDHGGFDPISSGDTNDESGIGGPLGTIVANVEGTADFTHFIMSGDTSDSSGNSHGLLLCAGEQSKVQSFYCPVLGAAPRWCSFLDNITEELEERDGMHDDPVGGAVQTETVYEDYKFLTRAEIDKLGIQNLVGTPLLRGYMHGFFVHVGLYNKIRAVAKPFEYSEYRLKKIKERMDEKKGSRIAPKVAQQKAKAKVNPDLADRLHAKAGDRTKSGKVAKALVEDDRFGRLFENKDFEIDEEAEDFKLRNPSGIAAKRVRNDRDMDSDQEDNDGDEDEYNNNEITSKKGSERWGNDSVSDDKYDDDNSHRSESDDDGLMGGRVRHELPNNEKKIEKKQDKKKKKKSRVVLQQAGDDALDIGLGYVSVEAEANERKKELSLTMEERLQLKSEQSIGETKRFKVKGQGPIVKEVTFIPKSSKKNTKFEDKAVNDNQGRKDRRGVKSLGLKTPFKHRQ